MAEQKIVGGLDFEALRRAHEQRDAGLLASLYAEDAEVHLINRRTPPSTPFALRGREAIAEYLRDICGNGMKPRIEREVVGEDRAAFSETCEYPDGTRLLSATTLEVRDGRIVREVSVEVWDE